MTVRLDLAQPALERGASLAHLNTLRVPARARWLADVHHPGQVPALLARPEIAGHPVLVLGEGSNVLFAGDFPGLVLRLRCNEASVVEDGGEAAVGLLETAVRTCPVPRIADFALDGLHRLSLQPNPTARSSLFRLALEDGLPAAVGAIQSGGFESPLDWQNRCYRF